ncbi:MFS transporter [Streptomyces xanthochromogenes]|uniref:MFS transporter n=1 Tax=Streptomyces xanthochromogenes TaxID=67384 RepID=A0ABQ3AER7_9ACTN|nr:MFS transporter [Streptomyces xanthochromogenes]GGY46100.1 MFS transporter [Streptomyces xanthochromogenes]
MATTTLIPPAPARPAHRDGNVLRWLAAYTSSLVGDSVYYMALSWAAARSGSAGQAGLVLAVGAVPRALLMLGGGVIADRFGPRRVVIGSDAARSLIILGMAAALLVTGPHLWLLIVLALVFGAVDAVLLPALGALPPRITGPGELARVQGLKGLAARVANIAGAPLGGLAVALGGTAATFAAAGALFAVSTVLLVRVRMARLDGDGQKAKEPPLRELTDGLRYIRRHRLLAPLMVVLAVGELGFAAPLNIGLTLLAQERSWGAAGMGWVVAAFGAGAGAASLLLSVRGRLPRAGLVLPVSLLGGTTGIAGLAYAPSVALAAVAGVLIGLLAGLSGALCGALVQTATEPAYLGRVTAVASLFTLGIAPLGYPLAGAAIGLWGTGPVFLASAGVCATGALIGLASGHLRRAELPR